MIDSKEEEEKYMYNNGIYCEINDEKTKQNLIDARQYMPYIYEDARSYQSAMKREDYNKAVAEAQQIGEKSLKAIAKKNGHLSNNLRKGKNGHNLNKLSSGCGCDVQVSKESLQKLTNGYFNARYPESKMKYNKEEAEEMGMVAFKLMDKTIEELDIQYSELDKELGYNKEQKSIDDLSTFNRLMR